ncbi:hypothetical protein KSF78_0006941 [Schistosoma japonicum]|nr:hypothetical protein KSF78_0006941 [Schistosoma japonicum]KAH8859438.1 hypothetical protein KSF78_0006941 [Schistosoma japonicum]KAH8859439.1 hypothetical protein KSF78_0006941 [Schistosoma japonicum]
MKYVKTKLVYFEALLIECLSRILDICETMFCMFINIRVSDCNIMIFPVFFSSLSYKFPTNPYKVDIFRDSVGLSRLEQSFLKVLPCQTDRLKSYGTKNNMCKV